MQHPPNLFSRAQHSFQELLHWPGSPATLSASNSDLGQWLCAPRFHVVCLFQASLRDRNPFHGRTKGLSAGIEKTLAKNGLGTILLSLPQQLPELSSGVSDIPPSPGCGFLPSHYSVSSPPIGNLTVNVDLLPTNP